MTDRVMIRFDSDVSGLLNGMRAIDAEAQKLAASANLPAPALPSFTPPPTPISPAQLGQQVGQRVGIQQQVQRGALESLGTSTKSQIDTEVRNTAKAGARALEVSLRQLGVAEEEIAAALRQYKTAIAGVTRRTNQAMQNPENLGLSRGEVAAQQAARPAPVIPDASAAEAQKKLRVAEDAQALANRKLAETNAQVEALQKVSGNRFHYDQEAYKEKSLEQDRITKAQGRRREFEDPAFREQIAQEYAEQAVFVKAQSAAEQNQLRQLLTRNEEFRSAFGQDAALRQANRGIIQSAEAAAFNANPQLRKEVTRGRADQTIEQAVQKSDVEGILNADAQYIKAMGEAAAFRASTNAQVAADTQLMLSVDEAYIKATGEAAAIAASNSARSGVVKEETLAADTQYLAAKTRETVLTAARVASEQQALAADPAYAQAKADAAVAQKQINTRVQALTELALAADTEYIKERTQLTLATAARVAKEQIALAEAYVTDPSRAATVGAGRAATDAVRTADELATLRAKLSTPGQIDTEGETVAARKAVEQQRTIAAERALLLDTNFIANQEELLVLQNQRKKGEAIAAGSAAVQAEKAEIELVNLKNAQAYARQTAVGTAIGNEMLATRVETNTLMDLQNAALKAELAANPAYLEAQAKLTVSRELLAKAQLEATNIELAKAGLAPKAVPGASGSPGLDNVTKRLKGTFGNFFGGGLASTIKYAVPSVALFGAVSGISNAIEEANELNVEFARLEGQFEATFGASAQEELRKFKAGILESARATGTPAQDVADVSRQLQGAFGPDTGTVLPDTQGNKLSGQDLVNEQKQAVLELIKVTGIGKQEAVDAATAISLSFGVTARSVGDVTQKLEDLTGVRAQDTFSAIADSAPAAKEAGYSLEEYAALITVINQKSGRSGTAIAESLNRILPEVTKNKTALLELSAQEDALNNKPFLEAIGSGKARNVLDQIGLQFDKLSKQGQDLVVQLLGGEKNAKDIIPALASDAQRRELTVEVSDGGSSGALEKRFEQVMETLANRFDQLKEKARQLGVTLLESGLNDVLQDAVSFLDLLVTGFGGAVGLVGDLNSALGGVPVRLGEALLLAKAIQATLNAAAGTKLLGGIASGLGGVAKLADGTRPAAGVGLLSRLKGVVGRGAEGSTVAVEIGGAITASGTTAAAEMGAAIVAAGATAAAEMGSAVAAGGLVGGVDDIAKAAIPATPALFGAAGGAAGAGAGTGLAAGAGAGAAGGTALAGIAVPALALAGTIIAVKTYFDTREKVKEANEKLFRELKKRKDLDTVTESDVEGIGFVDFFRENVFGGDSPQELIDRAKRAKQAEKDAEELKFAREQAKIKNSQIVAAATGGQAIEGFVPPTAPVGNTLPVHGRANDQVYDTQDENGNKWRWDYETTAWNLVELGPLPGDKKKKGAEPIPGGLDLKAPGYSFQGKNVDAAQLAQELGIDYGLEKLPDLPESASRDAETNSTAAALVGKKKQVKDIQDKLSENERTQFEALAKRVRGAVESQKGFDDLSDSDKVEARSKALQLLVDGNVKKIEAGAKDGDLASAAALEVLKKSAQEDPVIQAAVKAAEAKLKMIQDLGAPTGNGSQIQLEELLKAYETGDASSTEVIANFDGITEGYIKLAAASGGKLDSETLAAARKNIAAKAKFYAKVVQDRNALSREINDLSGRSPQESATQIEIEGISALRDPNFTDRQARFDVAKEIVTAQRERFNAAVGEAKTAQEAYAIMQKGFTIPQEVREALIAQQLNESPDFTAFAEQYEAATGRTAEVLVAQLVALFTAGKASKDKIKAVFAAEMPALLQLLAEANAEVEKLEGALSVDDRIRINPAQRDASSTKGKKQDALNDARKKAGAINEAIESLGAFDAGTIDDITIPPTEGGATPEELEKAKKAAEAEKKKLKDLFIDQLRALVGLANAINGDGSFEALARNIELANAELAAANEDAASAENPEEKARAAIAQLNAQKAKVEAQRAQRNAIRDLQNAENDLLVAIVDGTGNTVKVAQLGLRQARETLNQMLASKAQGLGDYTDADVTRQRAEVVRAGTAVRDAQYRKAADDIDFNLTMERITKKQAIEQLKAQRALYANNEQITREIDRKIHELEGQVNQEFKFNIPKLLGLPTLYEVRRLNQTGGEGSSSSSVGGASIGYQDNRNVQITLLVNSGLDEQQAMQMLGDALGNTRNGVSVKRY